MATDAPPGGSSPSPTSPAAAAACGAAVLQASPSHELERVLLALLEGHPLE